MCGSGPQRVADRCFTMNAAKRAGAACAASVFQYASVEFAQEKHAVGPKRYDSRPCRVCLHRRETTTDHYRSLSISNSQ